jgi:hypothetical protein
MMVSLLPHKSPNPALQPTAAERLGLRLLLEPIYGF